MSTPCANVHARSLDPLAFDYYAGGADDEVTLADNEAAWQRIRLLPKVLRDVSARRPLDDRAGAAKSPRRSWWRRRRTSGWRDDEGEAATARGAAAAGTLMCVSTLATCRWRTSRPRRRRPRAGSSCTSAATARSPRTWSQRAKAAGYSALVLTVDLPVLGRRWRDERNNFTLPDGLVMANFDEAAPKVEGSGLAAYADAEFDRTLTFDDITWLRDVSGLPVVVKGVLASRRRARRPSLPAPPGVVVSNHGARQLDTAVATADALPAIAEAVGDAAEVYVDGGIRRGTDVLKAIALGARAVLVGRPVLWGLATGGADGVRDVLDELIDEFVRALTLCGAPTPDDVTPDLLARSPPHDHRRHHRRDRHLRQGAVRSAAGRSRCRRRSSALRGARSTRPSTAGRR